MTRRRALIILFFLTSIAPAVAQSPGPVGKEGEIRREQVWNIPAAGGAPLMISTVMRPPGEAPHPLVVINHSEPVVPAFRPKMPRQRYVGLDSWFVDHGYVVVQPLRRGYGPTGGAWAEDYGSCEKPDYYAAGLQTASDIEASLVYMRQQPFVAAEHTVVVGNDAGGWGTIALSSRNPPGVAGMINFAGGRGGHRRLANGTVGTCDFPALVEAAERYGRTARVPTLWLYAENDSFYRPAAMKRVADAYVRAGGKATFTTTAALPPEGHNLATSDASTSIWASPIEHFLVDLK